MSLQHLNVKLFVDGPVTINLEDVIKLFHDWVANQSLNEMLIDVVDYRHVPNGPSVVLVGHEAHYAFDQTDGRPGLLYNRRTPLDGSDANRVEQAFRAAAFVCGQLEIVFPDLHFSRTEFQILVNDRAVATVGSAGESLLRESVQDFVQQSLGQDPADLQAETDPKRRAGLMVKLARPFDLQPAQAS